VAFGNAAVASFFSSLETETTTSKTDRTRNAAAADVFDYIKRFYNPLCKRSFNGVCFGGI